MEMNEISAQLTLKDGHRSGAWLDDDDCLICNHCRKAIDFHKQPDVDGRFAVPAYCPLCGDKKHELKRA